MNNQFVFNQSITNNFSNYSELDVKTPILDVLEQYYNNPSVHMHIPGHAGRGVLPRFKELIGTRMVKLDTTDEFDNLGTLYPASGAIKEAQELAANAFGAKRTFFLNNGSTGGNLALALTVAKKGTKVLVGRNCHRSIISGIVLSGAEPIWVIPERLEQWGLWGEISSHNIAKLLDENPDTSLVWVTNPTYEGVLTDVASISAVCKERNVMLIVDEAHGALWNFNDKLPISALKLGADAVVHSVHKTAGSFSQSSMLHLGKNSSIDENELESNLRMLNTTSPSYILLASLDAARGMLESNYGKEKIEISLKNANKIRKRLEGIPQIHCLNSDENIKVDPTKIYLMIDGLSGKRIDSILTREYHLEVEAGTDNGILALCNIGNSESDINYFIECLISIVNSEYSDISYLDKSKYMPFHTPIIKLSPQEAYHRKKVSISPDKAIGMIAGEIIAECPPGIPILVPGELITQEHMSYLTSYKTIAVCV